MGLPTLEELHRARTGKVSDKWSSYLSAYNRLFAEVRERPVRILEIGVQNGGSLETWAAFFPNATQIVGCDIDPACAQLRFDDTRVSVVVGDATHDETKAAIAELCPRFDIIIEDGSHRSSDIAKAFAHYFPLIEDGGIFVAEDLHCSYWHDYEGGLYHPLSSISFFKRLADIINHEHWGLTKARSEVLEGFAKNYCLELSDECLRSVHSVEFLNSICVVRRDEARHNSLGERLVSGAAEDVTRGLAASHLQASVARDESANTWANRDRPPAEELAQRLAELGAAHGEIQRLHEELRQAYTLLHEANLRAESDQQRRTTDLERWRTQLAARDREVASAQTRLRELQQELVLRDHALREHEAKLAGRVSEVEQLADRVRRLNGRVTRSEAALKKNRQSVSWRVTKPLRKAGGVMRDPFRKGAWLRTKLEPLEPEGGFELAFRRARKVLRQQGPLAIGKRLLERQESAPLGEKCSTHVGLAEAPECAPPPPEFDRNNYGEWLRCYDTLSDVGRAALGAHAQAFAIRPLISIVMPTFNARVDWLGEAIDSVRAQIYPHWELCIVDDASTDPAVRRELERRSQEDPRIKVHFRESNGHICASSNDGLDMATGAFVALLDHDDLLREHALFWVVEALNRVPAAKILYSDEDKLGEDGRRYSPYFKPDWNEDLFLSHNLISHLGVYETKMVRDLGGFRQGFEGSQDYDLALRCVENVSRDQIVHIPRVLYTWRVHAASTAQSGEAKPYALLAGRRALLEHFERAGVKADVEFNEFSQYRVRYELPANLPRVSIIIPTRNAVDLVRQCVESIRDRTSYSNYEIILVDNGSDDHEALRYFDDLRRREGVRVIRDERPFNYSALNNAAVESSSGEFLCLVNNDIEVISPDWLSEMVSIGLQRGVGAVGARLWYPDDTLQHGGVIVGLGGVACHSHKHLPRGDYGFCGRAALIQSLTAVTGACLLVRKSAYQLVGGLDENDLKVAFNDVDLCLKLREAGYRNVWTPYAELYHHESATRGVEDTPEKKARFLHECRFMQIRWAHVIASDPAYSPNLTISHEDFSLAWPPRLQVVS